LLIGWAKLILSEHCDAVAVLEGQLNAKMLLQSASHGVACQDPQQLPACLFAWWRYLVVDKTLSANAQSVNEPFDKLPGIGQRLPLRCLY